MLQIPETYYGYNILAIDPGLNNTGVAVYTINENYESNLINKISNIEVFTFITKKLLSSENINLDIHTERLEKLIALKQAMQYTLNIYKPVLVVCESPFFNSLRPSAYSSLVETISYIQSSIFEYNPNIYFTTVEPLLVKKRVGAGYVNGKHDMRVAVTQNTELQYILRNIDITMLDEHSIDAVAIGYGFLKNLEVIK